MITAESSIPRTPKGALAWHAGIFAAVALFNLVAVFGPDTLLHDDPSGYRTMIHGQYGAWAASFGKFNAALPLTEWIGWNLMVASPYLARAVYVIVLLVPISCLLFHFYSATLGFARVTSFAAAVVPNILPQQAEIPAGINMSYVAWGLLLALVSFLFAVKYLEDARPAGSRWLVRSACAFLVATQVTEQALFLYPPVLLAIAISSYDGTRRWRLGWTFSLVAATKVAHIALLPRLRPEALTFEEMGDRIRQYLEWSMPFPRESWPYALGLLALAALATAGLRAPRRDGHPEVAQRPTRLDVKCLAVCVCWSLSTMLVFLVASRWYTVRYTYYSAFGLVAALVLVLDVLAARLPSVTARYLLLGGLVLVAGVLRFEYLREAYSGDNTTLAVIRRDVGKIDLPPKSQVVIVGDESVAGLANLGGGWYRSGGNLQFALKRPDVTGLIGAWTDSGYFNFDDHFDPGLRGNSPRHEMTGLRDNEPLFLFLAKPGGKSLRQLDLALQWRGSSGAAPWRIIKTDRTTGTISRLVEGVGMPAYLEALRELGKSGVRQSDILWGGPPAGREMTRLGDLRPANQEPS